MTTTTPRYGHDMTEHVHGHLWVTSKPDAKRDAAEVIARHIDRQPWTHERPLFQRAFAGIVTALICGTIILLALAALRLAYTWATGS